MSIYQYNGKQYGIPWDMGMIGFWYNKALFTQAGITAPPTTWDDYLADVGKLKAAGHHAARDRGQGRVAVHAPLDVPGPPQRRRRCARPDDPDRQLEHRRLHEGRRRTSLALNALNPYQAGYKAATYNNEAASVGNGKAAMELMGQWAPSVQKDQSANKQGLGDELGWFAFPAVTGGAALRPTASAAATASRWARTRRPRRSTS